MTSHLLSQLRKDIEGKSGVDFSGRSVNISDHEKIIAIGCYGNDIDDAGEYFSHSISLSAVGNTIAINSF